MAASSSSPSSDSPHLRGEIIFSERLNYYVRSNKHIVLYYGTGNEIAVPFDVLTTKYKFFEMFFDEKMSAMIKSDDSIEKYHNDYSRNYVRKLAQYRDVLVSYGAKFNPNGTMSVKPTRPQNNTDEFDRAIEFVTLPEPQQPSGLFDLDKLSPEGLIQTDVENKMVLKDEENNLIRRNITEKEISIMIDLAFWTILYSKKRKPILDQLHPEIIREYHLHFGYDEEYIPEFRIPKELAFQCLELFKLIE